MALYPTEDRAASAIPRTALALQLEEDGMSAGRMIPALTALAFCAFLAVLPASATVPRIVLAEDFTATW